MWFGAPFSFFYPYNIPGSGKLAAHRAPFVRCSTRVAAPRRGSAPVHACTLHSLLPKCTLFHACLPHFHLLLLSNPTRLSPLSLLELAACCLRCRSLAIAAPAPCHLTSPSSLAFLLQHQPHLSTEQQRSYKQCAAGMPRMIPDQRFPEPAPAFTVLLSSFIPGKLTCRRCTSAKLPALYGTPAHRVRQINKREFPAYGSPGIRVRTLSNGHPLLKCHRPI